PDLGRSISTSSRPQRKVPRMGPSRGTGTSGPAGGERITVVAPATNPRPTISTRVGVLAGTRDGVRLYNSGVGSGYSACRPSAGQRQAGSELAHSSESQSHLFCPNSRSQFESSPALISLVITWRFILNSG